MKKLTLIKFATFFAVLLLNSCGDKKVTEPAGGSTTEPAAAPTPQAPKVPDFTVASYDLYNEFQENEQGALAKYSLKIVEVTGEVMAIRPGPHPGSKSVALKGIKEINLGAIYFHIEAENVASIEGIKEGDQVTLMGELRTMSLGLNVNVYDATLVKK